MKRRRNHRREISAPARTAAGTGFVVSFAVGALLRMGPLTVPWSVRKYGGSAGWAAAIFWLVRLLAPRLRTRSAALITSLIAIAIECFKLVRIPVVDAFRSTLAGKLLLGRWFAWKDIAAYLIAITFCALVDGTLRHRSR